MKSLDQEARAGIQAPGRAGGCSREGLRVWGRGPGFTPSPAILATAMSPNAKGFI